MTVGWTDDGQQIRKYIGTFRTREEAINALANYNQNPYDADLLKLTFAELWQQWCKHKYKDAPVKSVYAAAYKNLSALHKQIFPLTESGARISFDACRQAAFDGTEQYKFRAITPTNFVKFLIFD